MPGKVLQFKPNQQELIVTQRNLEDFFRVACLLNHCCWLARKNPALAYHQLHRLEKYSRPWFIQLYFAALNYIKLFLEAEHYGK